MNVEFDSYIIPTNELPTDGFRLLDVDNRVILHINSQIRILLTGADVIHSRTIPAKLLLKFQTSSRHPLNISTGPNVISFGRFAGLAQVKYKKVVYNRF